MTPEDAYLAGRKAYMLGDNNLENPFRIGSELEREWDRGWQDARKEQTHGEV